ncbi:MAG TPA: C25 family cysteine peptidase, partial [Wenzhouxiangellaceae bacterium]|nr:C25 family cysteine peptidase [Wenzhouxiangellaceae bacterium]
QEVTPAPIPWQEVRNQAKLRGQLHAAERKRMAGVQSRGSNAASRPDYVDIRVTEPGLQEISWQMLADAGMDLNGVAAEDIAVTLKGEPVSRHVVDPNPRRVGSALRAAGQASERGLRFGPGGKIRFWGTAPSTADSIYVDHYVYRVSVARGAGLAARKSYARATELTDSHMRWQRQDIDTGYHFASTLKDPWYAARLRADRNNTYTTHFTVDNALVTDQPGRLKVLIAGLTDFPEAPDHRALVELNGQVLGESIFDGQAVRMLDLEVPVGLLTTGENTVRVIAPGGTAAPFDLFLVDTVELGYPRDLAAMNGRLLVESAAPSTGLAVSGLSPAEAVAYGWDGERLHLLNPRRHSARAFSVATLDAPNASYWISGSDRIYRPQLVGAANRPGIFGGDASDLLVITHPAFMPVSRNESHPLNDYIAQREEEGWSVGLYDITEIQAEFGHGMPLPQSVTAFLKAADRRFDYEHVLLVGGDSYDYTDNLGLGGLSFIPTRYAATSRIPHTPSDALLADLDGDGLSDKAVGRWPVRTAGDLEAIVAKTLDWPNINHPQSSVWMTDSEDSRTGSFNRQADRVLATLENADWPADALNRVYFNQTAPRPGMSVADSARDDLFDLLEQGRALTGFVGHGAPAMWSFQGMVTPDDLSDLHNEGNPTMIGTMTCYTSYFVSPAGDSVAHRWMNGYRENAAGNRIPGVANG